MNNEKRYFLHTELFDKLSSLDPNAPAQWGKMNVLQMIEHLSYSLRYANGKDPHERILTPAERLDAVRDFMFSEKEFKPNTKNALMSEEPAPAVNSNKEEALKELRAEMDAFFNRFEAEPGLRVRNPFFGDLDFDGWVHLFHKHFNHHLKQFNAK